MSNNPGGGLVFLSWNVRGMRDKIKCGAIFQYFSRLKPHMICLQETHLQPDSVRLLCSCKFPTQFPSIYFLQWSDCADIYSYLCLCLEQRIYRDGSYVFLLCKLQGFLCIEAAIYAPPPAILLGPS